MFKRFTSITFIAAAIAMLLALSVMPHHHHGGAACMEMIMCESDGRINDEHTDHHSHEGQPFADKCVAEKNFIRAVNENEDQCGTPGCSEGGHFHLFDAFLILAEQPVESSELLSVEFEYGEPVISYCSADVRLSNGLRGPPFLIS